MYGMKTNFMVNITDLCLEPSHPLPATASDNLVPLLGGNMARLASMTKAGFLLLSIIWTPIPLTT